MCECMSLGCVGGLCFFYCWEAVSRVLKDLWGGEERGMGEVFVIEIEGNGIRGVGLWGGGERVSAMFMGYYFL